MVQSNGRNRAFSRADAEGHSQAIKVPRHIAIIMDGNGRWARSRFLPRVEGHRNGAKTVRMVVEECRKLGVEYLTLFAFSTENWQRPADEVNSLMFLFMQYLASEADRLAENGIRLRAAGDLTKLSPKVRESLEAAELRTAEGKNMELILAISYGGREELVNAARTIAEKVQQGILDPSHITADVMRQHLYLPHVPDPDLLIRTSDENRISNFLLWQLAYAEIVVTPVFWPAFDREEFFRCLREFSGRKRRFGLTEEQISRMESAPIPATA